MTTTPSLRAESTAAAVRAISTITEPTEHVIQRSLTLVAAVLSSMWLGWVAVVGVTDHLATGVEHHGVGYLTVLVVAVATSLLAWLTWFAQTRVVRGDFAASLPGEGPVARAVADARAGRRPSGTRVRLLALLLVLVCLAGISLATLAAPRDQVDPVGVEELARWGSVLLACIGSVLVSAFAAEAWRWAYVAAATLAAVPAILSPLTSDATASRHTAAMAVIAMCFILGEVYYLRGLSSTGDAVLRASTNAVVDTAAGAAATAEASRIDGLVHDHILAALLLASRADERSDGPLVRRSAAGALAALSDIAAPEATSRPGREGDLEVTEFATNLIREIRALDPTIVTAGRGSRSAPVPERVATTTTAATLEAVRNSLRHGDGGGSVVVTRRVTVWATEDGVTITVADDGVGFDPASAPKGRFGISGSILGRMDALAGGSGRIESAPGAGTVVTLAWSDAAARDAAAVAGPAGPTGPSARAAGNSQEGGSPHDTDEHRFYNQFGDAPAADLPFGPTLRASLGVAAGVLYLAISAMPLMDPIWPNIVSLAVFVTLFTVVVRSWSDDPTVDPPPYAAVLVALGSPTILVLTLSAWPATEAPETMLWTVALAHLLVALLAFSNYPRLSWLLALMAATVLIVRGLTVGDGWSYRGVSLFLFLFLPTAANRIHRTAFAAMASSAELAAAQREVADTRARDVAALTARRSRGQRVDNLARPLLERLAVGERTDPAVRVEAAQLEAHLRDDLRARCFRDTDVTRAANDARRAGVRVELMDDGALIDAPQELREEVIDTAVAVLDAAAGGSVIVRVGPPGREVVATFLVETPEGATERLEISRRPAAARRGVG